MDSTERELAAQVLGRCVKMAFGCLKDHGDLQPMAVFVRDGRERAIALLAFDDERSKERCYEGVAALAEATAAQMVVFVNDALMSVLGLGDGGAQLPSQDPAARNCLVVTVVGMQGASVVPVPYHVADDGSAVPDVEAAKELKASLPWWSAPTVRVVRDAMGRTPADGPAIRSVADRWAPEIAAVASFE